MGNYADIGDLKGRLPNRSFTVTSAPSIVTVTSWFEEAEAEVDGELVAAGFSVPITTTRGKNYLRGKVTDKVCSMVVSSYAVGTDLETDDVGEEKAGAFEKFLDQIRKHPERMAAILGIGGSDQRTKLRAYQTDNVDGKTIEAGDFDPERTRDEVF